LGVQKLQVSVQQQGHPAKTARREGVVHFGGAANVDHGKACSFFQRRPACRPATVSREGAHMTITRIKTKQGIKSILTYWYKGFRYRPRLKGVNLTADQEKKAAHAA